MNGHATIIHPNGRIEEQELAGVPPLEILQKWVGGWIEMLPYFDTYKGSPCVAYCNEEGKLRNLPLNIEATALWSEASETTVMSDWLVGPVVILTGDKEFMRAL